MMTPVFAVGEKAEMAVYQAPAGSYSFSYPSSWMLVDRESFEAIQTLADQHSAEAGRIMTEELKPKIEELGMAFLVSSDWLRHISIDCQEAMGMTADNLSGIQNIVVTLMLANGYETLQGPEILDMDDGRQVLVVTYSYEKAGTEGVGVQAYMATADTLYTFTLTSSQEKVEKDLVVLAVMLSSSELK